MDTMQSFGKKGEEAAVEFLQRNDYTVLETNYRFRRSEIDIICKKDNVLVFVEVKTRSSKKYGEPEAFVSKNQQRSIMKAAEEFIMANHWMKDIRFDIIAILDHKGREELLHIQDAFY